MTHRKLYHIVMNQTGGWDFKMHETGEILQKREQKEELLNYAENYCRSHSSILVILNKNKVVEDARTFGDEKFNPVMRYQHYDRYLK